MWTSGRCADRTVPRRIVDMAHVTDQAAGGSARPSRGNLRLVSRGRLALLACGVTVVVAAARPILPHLPLGVFYSQGFAPAWIALLAALLGLVPAAAAAGVVPVPRGTLTTALSVSVVLLTWSAAGVMLDVFRLFFYVSGIPAGNFSVVDWPAFAVRAASMVALALVLVSGLGARRAATPDACEQCGRAATMAGWRHRNGPVTRRSASASPIPR